FGLGAVWAGALVVRPFPVRGSLWLIPLGATVLWGLLQLLMRTTVNRWDTWMSVAAWAGNLVACLLALQIGQTNHIRRQFLNTLLYFSFLLSIVSVVQYFDWNGKIFWLYPTYDTAVLGPFVNRNQYAAFMEMVLPLGLVQALGGGPKGM